MNTNHFVYIESGLLFVSMDTPLDKVIKQYPDRKQDIIKYDEKWQEQTKGLTLAWPIGGTFNPNTLSGLHTWIETVKKGKHRKHHSGILNLWHTVAHQAAQDVRVCSLTDKGMANSF